MTPEDGADLRRRADRLLDELLDLDDTLRAERLAAVAAAEPGLAALVGRLLAAAGETASDFERWREAAAAFGAGPAPEPASGARFGAWRIVAPLARGGMSQVFVAERVEGGFRQRAALKLFTAQASPADSLARRFEQERQILAALEHPNIARVLDGGVAADGRPFLVLELVDGEPIDVWCARHALALAPRLELLSVVARTVHFAHRNLIVHRDLKPSNVLVTVDGTVKLLDFGIAKVLEGSQALAGAPLAAPETRTTARPLTPAYAAPEQLLGGVITTASDVYQLGLLLYELVGGRPAHVFREDSWRELERVVCEVDPPRLGHLPEATSGVGRRGVRVPGDLETIVFKALQKDPARRYVSAEQLAEDLDRFLADQPVVARPDTVTYRARKFVRRHRVAVAGAAAVALLVLGSAAALVRLSARLAGERDRARSEARRAEAVTGLLVGLFDAADPELAAGAVPDARELLDRGAARLESELAPEPALLRTLLPRVAEMNLRLNRAGVAERLARRALELARTAAAGGDDAARADVARAELLLGWAADAQGRYAESARLYLSALRALERLTPRDEPEIFLARLGYGNALQRLGRPADAAAEIATSLAAAAGGVAVDAVALGNAWGSLSVARLDAGDAAGAEAAAREGLRGLTAAFGPDHPRLLFALGNLARALETRGDLDGALENYRRSIEMRRRVYGEESPAMATALHNLARLESVRGQIEAACETGARALALRERLLGAGHPDTALTRSNLGIAVREAGEPARALVLLDAALAAQRAALGDDHRLTQSTRSYRAFALLDLGRVAEATAEEGMARAVLAQAPARDATSAALLLGRLALARGERDAAREMLRRAEESGGALGNPGFRPLVEARLLAAALDAATSPSPAARDRLAAAAAAAAPQTPRLHALAARLGAGEETATTSLAAFRGEPARR